MMVLNNERSMNRLLCVSKTGSLGLERGQGNFLQKTGEAMK